MSLTLPEAMLSDMEEEKRKQYLSKAYVRAIAARAGLNIYSGEDDYGVDIGFTRVKKRADDGRLTDIPDFPLFCQLKASKKCRRQGEEITYFLDSKNYNDLVGSKNSVLIVLWLPDHIDDWLSYDENSLIIFKCAYYHKITSRTPLPANASGKTIYIPRTQTVTEEALLRLIEDVQRGFRPL